MANKNPLKEINTETNASHKDSGTSFLLYLLMKLYNVLGLYLIFPVLE